MKTYFIACCGSGRKKRELFQTRVFPAQRGEYGVLAVKSIGLISQARNLTIAAKSSECKVLQGSVCLCIDFVWPL